MDTGKPVPKAGLAAVPTPADGTDNVYERDVIGNKADTALYAAAATASMMRYLKALLGSAIIATGTFTTSSATVPADTGKAAVATNFYNGCIIMPLTGACAMQPRRIAKFTTTTGEYMIDPARPFTAATGAVTYIIIAEQDSQFNALTFGVFTTSSATVPADNTSGIQTKATGYYNGCLLMPLSGVCAFQPRRILVFTTSTGVFTLNVNRPFTAAPGAVPYLIFTDQEESFNALAYGTFTTSSTTVPADTGKSAYVNDYFKGCTLMPLTGVCAFQPRLIKQFTTATGVYTLDDPFTTLPSTVPYVIMGPQQPIQRLLDIFDQTNAILELKETGQSQLTTDGTEQTCYINNSPQGVFKPLNFLIDTTAMAAGDEIHVRVYYILKSGGSYIKFVDTTYSGAQDPDGKNFELLVNRFGVKVTVQRTALGVDRAYDWEVFYENA